MERFIFYLDNVQENTYSVYDNETSLVVSAGNEYKEAQQITNRLNSSIFLVRLAAFIEYGIKQ